jgi:hypothetical protein
MVKIMLTIPKPAAVLESVFATEPDAADGFAFAGVDEAAVEDIFSK